MPFSLMMWAVKYLFIFLCLLLTGYFVLAAEWIEILSRKILPLFHVIIYLFPPNSSSIFMDLLFEIISLIPGIYKINVFIKS